MTLNEFRTIPLIRRFISLDERSGDMLRHEVRRDPATGLTLTLGFNLLTGRPVHTAPQQQN